MSYPRNLLYASPRLKFNVAFVESLVTGNPSIKHYVADRIKPEIFDNFPDELKDNEKFCLDVILKTPSLLKYVSPRLKGNTLFVTPVVQKEPYSFAHVSPKLLDDENFCRPIEADNPRLKCYVSDRLQEDNVFIKSCEKPVSKISVSDDVLFDYLFEKIRVLDNRPVGRLTRNKLL